MFSAEAPLFLPKGGAFVFRHAHPAESKLLALSINYLYV